MRVAGATMCRTKLERGDRSVAPDEGPVMRVAALYDIHGNLPALEAVLRDVGQAGADQIVVGGDVVPGPMPRETLRRLVELDLPVHFIHGNCELAVLAQMAAGQTGSVDYWGTASGRPLPEPLQEGMRWTAQQLGTEYQAVLARWPRTVRLDIPGLGNVLFCHSTPRSETEIFTRLTAEERLLPIFDELEASMAVCGHTHMQFDRMIGRTRVVNAGSVGMPFGDPGAFWALLGPDVQLRRTSYDLARAAELIRDTPYPQARDDSESILHPPSEHEMLEVYGKAELK
jgi:predicted phosphodiesterase